ncbi:MAG: hypothetical protein AB1Z98_32370 [Nannocystaceae bacterium]
MLHDDLELAQVAYAVDPVSVEAILDEFENELANAKESGRTTDTPAERATPPLSALLPPALTSAEGATELAIRFATALGKLAIDRAKQEAVLWALDELGTRVCGNEGGLARKRVNPVVSSEIRTYWMPQMCTLTTKENLSSGFGAGQAMLTALVSAVENDAKHLPGAAAGLLVGLGYWAEDEGGTIQGAFDCGLPDASSANTKACGRLEEVRRSTASAVNGLLDGADPVDEARTWSAAIDELNRVHIETAPTKGDDPKPTKQALAAPLSQLAACSVAVAAELGADDTRRTVLDPEDGSLSERRRVLAALTSAPACWTLTGKGWTKDGEEQLALDRAELGDVERLSTLIRIDEYFETTQVKAGDAWRKLSGVASRVRGARARLKKTIGDASSRSETRSSLIAAITALDGGTLERQDIRDLIGEASLDEAKDRLSAGLDLAEELVAAADATAVLLAQLSNTDELKSKLLPGLWKRSDDTAQRPTWIDDLAELESPIESFRGKLDEAQQLIDALRELVAGDWAAASTKVLTTAQALLERNTGRTDSSVTTDGNASTTGAEPAKPPLEERVEALETKIGELENKIKNLESSQKRALRKRIKVLQAAKKADPKQVITTLTELVGLFSSIAAAEDADDIAVILEKTASPPGSWRRKQVEGSFTLSLGSHVGVYTALELRRGQYGVVYEDLSTHVQAPTLSVPIGFDLAWGVGRSTSLGVFVPIIDPAAFVHYDVAEDSRLPAPQPLTVFALGASLRLGIPRTPITVLAGYTWRPRLRTWEAGANEPGANAHQFGVSLAIDATFWNIVKR